MEDKGFKEELADLLNKYSRENRSNTPDFILALYLVRCLLVFDLACKEREKWYGHYHAPGGDEIPADPPTAPEPKKPAADLCFTCDHDATCTMGRVPGYTKCNMYGPIRSAAPEAEKEDWKPEPDKRALDRDGLRIIVRGLWPAGDWAWVASSDDNDQGWLVPASSLRPLPTEAPVKLGHRVSVTKEGLEFVGKVSGVNPEDRSFTLFRVGSFRWDEPGQKIVELRPVES